MPRRSRVASSACVGRPAIRISPAVGSSRRLISLRAVVLPEPLRPSSTSVSPGATPKDTDRKSTRLNSSHSQISYAVFCLKKKKTELTYTHRQNTYDVLCLKKNTITLATYIVNILLVPIDYMLEQAYH